MGLGYPPQTNREPHKAYLALFWGVPSHFGERRFWKSLAQCVEAASRPVGRNGTQEYTWVVTGTLKM